MNGPIQVIPQGLLGLLNLKNNGELPRELGGVVTPYLDMLEMYVSGLLEQVSDPVAVAAALGSNASALVVPAGEAWFVRSLFCTTEVLGAGETITISAAISYNGLALIPLNQPQRAVAGGRLRVTSGDEIILAPPASVFGFFVQELTGAVNVDVQALIARVRV